MEKRELKLGFFSRILVFFKGVEVVQVNTYFIPEPILNNEDELKNYISVRGVDVKDVLASELIKKGMLKISHTFGKDRGKKTLVVKASINVKV